MRLIIWTFFCPSGSKRVARTKHFFQAVSQSHIVPAVVSTVMLMLFASAPAGAQNTLDLAGLSSAAPAKLAYSLRLLSSDYSGPLVAIRRSSDDAVADFGDDGAGELDTTALLAFVGSGDGYVDTWYDQSGNGINGTQSSTSLQPRIVNAGVLERWHSRPTIRFNATTCIDAGSSAYSITAARTLSTSFCFDSGGLSWVIDRVSSSTPLTSFLSDGTAFFRNDAGSTRTVGSSLTTPVYNTHTMIWDNTDTVRLYRQGVAAGKTRLTLPSTMERMRIGRWVNATDYNKLYISEVILFASALPDDERQAMETGQVDRYICGIPAITGNLQICPPATASTLANTFPDGTWSSSNTAVATVGSTDGSVVAVSGGTATISYTVDGCSVTSEVTVHAVPSISSVSPLNGVPGSSLTISGTDFSATTSDNTVYFGATKANVATASETSLSVTQPVGATFFPVSVTNAACSLTAWSHYPFLPTYTNTPYVADTVNFEDRIDLADFGILQSVAIGDIDGDGKPDLAATCWDGHVSVYRNISVSGSLSSASFAAPVTFAEADGTHSPADIALGDIDGDGKLDIAISYFDDTNVSIYQNLSVPGTIDTTSLGSPVVFPVGSNPFGILLQDLDGDGFADLAVTNHSGYSISVLRNSAAGGIFNSGTFEAKVDFAAGTAPFIIRATDFDGDGKPDLAVANRFGNNISVFRNAASPGSISTSSFDTRVDFATGNHVHGLAVGDLDGDGKQDIVSANYNDNSITVLRNTATSGSITSGSFATGVDLATGTNPFSVTLADINGDAKPDIVVANEGSATVSVFRNISSSGSITTGSFAAKEDYATATVPQGVAAGDLDGDAKPDLAIASWGEGVVSVLHNAATLLRPVITSVSASSGVPGSSMTLNGYNFNSTPANNTVFFGATKATVTSATDTSVDVTIPVGSTHREITLNNSALSLMGAAQYPFLPTFDNTDYVGGLANFDSAVNFSSGGGPWGVAIADIDGDGKADMAAINYTSNTLSIFRNISSSGSISSGSFAAKVDLATGTGPYHLAIGDLDGDGKPDLVAINRDGSTMSIWKNNASPGTITSGSFSSRIDYTTEFDPKGVVIVDIDGDGKPEIVVTNGYPGTVSIFKNECVAGSIDGTCFASHTEFTVEGNPSYVSAGDLDGDGKPDLITANPNPEKVSILRNTSIVGQIDAGSMAPYFSMGSVNLPIYASLVDIDGDGKLDALYTDVGNNKLVVQRNNATPGTLDATSFETPVEFTSYGQATGCAVGDFDGDGKPDIAVTNFNTATVSVFINTATSGAINSGSFADRLDFDAGTNPQYIAAGDLDGDNKADLVVGNNGAGTLSVLRNNIIGPVTGTDSLCTGSTTTLANVTTGGTWSSSNEAVATVGSASGIVTGVAAGTALISYAVGSGMVTVVVTVDELPDPGVITGTASLCVGDVRTLSDATSGGVWSSSNTAIAAVDGTGNVSGVAAGMATIDYTVTNGCGSMSATSVATVNASPTMGSGTTAVICGSGSATLSFPGGASYTWVPASGLSATTGSSVTASPSASQAYTVTGTVGSCTATATARVLVKPLPSPVVTADGATTFCPGSSVTLATNGAGGAMSFTTAIKYGGGTNEYLPQGAAPRTIEAWINPNFVNNGTIFNWGVGLSNQRSGLLYIGGRIYFVGEYNDLQGSIDLPLGTWTHLAITYDGTTLKLYVNGVLDGSDTKTLATTGTNFRFGYATSNQEPFDGMIDEIRVWDVARSETEIVANMNKSVSVFSDHLVAYYKLDETSGTTAADATLLGTDATLVNSPGFVTSSGATVNYSAYTWLPAAGTTSTIAATTAGAYSVSVTDADGCSGTSATAVTVTTYPDVAAIAGPASVSSGSGATYTCATPGGTWSSSDPSVISIDAATGLGAAAASGSATISYTVGTGCYKTRSVTVATTTLAPITGITAICMGSPTVLSTASGPGLSWSCSNTAVATVGLYSGLITPVSAGTATITFTKLSGEFITTVITINPLPDVITGSGSLCVGSTTILASATTGGTWTASIPAFSSVDGSTGEVTGLAAGASTITYTLATGCAVKKIVTVGASPAAIAGATSICSGSAVTLVCASPGGTWTSGSSSVATITSSGIITGVASGTSVVSYTLASGCATTITVTVSGAPPAISGPSEVCAGQTITLTNATSGGTWSSSNSSLATVGAATGIVSGVSTGTVNITYATSAACFTTTVVTVSGTLPAIGGPGILCEGDYITLTNSVAGGTWTSSDPAIATIDATVGVAHGLVGGTTRVTYTIGSGCVRTKVLTVNSVTSSPITGTASLCEGATTVLTCVTGSGWSSSNTAVATIGLYSGLVSGISAGTSVVTFTSYAGCTRTTIVTVMPVPAAIGGTLSLCKAATTTLTDATAGGTWASSNTSRAMVGSATGIVTGVNVGNAIITYRASNGCYRLAAATVNPLPNAGAITGPGAVAMGGSVTLVPSAPGGTWTTANAAIATVTPATGSSATLSGVSIGSVFITYTVTNGCGSAFRRRLFYVVSPRPGAVANDRSVNILRLYPNPTKGVVTLETLTGGHLDIYAGDGKLVYSNRVEAPSTVVTLPGELANGVYACRFSGDEGSSQVVMLVYER